MGKADSEKIVVVVLILGILLLGSLFVGNIMVNHVADKVIEKLQKEYSPSPYGPGLDPDKLDVTQFHNSR